jgi:carbamoyltransferase
MNILGINAFHGDASAALLADGSLISAVEEERFNRVKHWAGFPALAIGACLKGTDPQELAHVAISRDPRAQLWRKLLRVATRPGDWSRLRGRAGNSWRVAQVGREIHESGLNIPATARVHHVEHHRAHLASAFFASPFEEAAVISVDGFGDFSSVMWGVGKGSKIDVLGSVRFPHSLGIFYTAFTQFLGFPKYGDEYKMMGLAAYGEPRFLPEVRDVTQTREGQVRLNLDYFVHHSQGVDMTWDSGEPVLGTVFSRRLSEVFGKPRPARSEILAQHADLAASVQAVLEENYFALLNHVCQRTKQKRLCLAGGVALNCAANGKIFDGTPFQEIYVQPAAHDAGTSIGAALHVHHQLLNQPRQFVMRHVYYGSAYEPHQMREALDASGADYDRLDERQLIDRTAREIAAGRIVGWFQSRMEFGPRALGNRSILADPRSHEMKDILNRRIKYREPFRPFCPSVLAEATGEYFEIDYPSPFMVTAYKIKPEQRERIPAVTHADGTGRLQTVEKDVNPIYWKLIKRFGELTGVPILLNTSFNENEPIVNTPQEALECFLRTQMDVLVMGPFVLTKSAENLQLGEGRQALAAKG